MSVSMRSKILELDAETSRRMSLLDKPKAIRSAAAFFAHSGDSWFWLAGLALVGLVGDASWRRWALILGGSILITAVVVLAIKFTVKRSRPAGEWGAVYRATDPHSFPSGHAVRAALIAGMVLGLGPTGLGLVLLVWAPLVMLARVAMGVHYLSDVLAGALLGVLMAWINLGLFSRLLPLG